MIYKKAELNRNGQPICEICKVGYDRVLRHVTHRHGITAKEYKKKFGYNPRKGIISEQHARRARINVLKNFDAVIMKNLIIGGIKTRFKEGNTATDKTKVSRAASARMAEYWKSKKQTKDEMINEMIKKLSSGNSYYDPLFFDKK